MTNGTLQKAEAFLNDGELERSIVEQMAHGVIERELKAVAEQAMEKRDVLEHAGLDDQFLLGYCVGVLHTLPQLPAVLTDRQVTNDIMQMLSIRVVKRAYEELKKKAH